MSSPETLVTNAFNNAEEAADAAMELAESFLGSFAENLFTAPLVDLSWENIEAPELEAFPEAPTIETPTFTMPTAPEALVLEEPEIVIDDFDVAAPSIASQPVLDFGEKPEIVIGDAPEIYEPVAVSVPDAPVLEEVEAPTLLELVTPTFTGLDLHETELTAMQSAIPTLTLVAPTAYSYTPGAEYTSALKTAISSALETRVAGGTGLSVGVETAIWGRDADRETAVLQANIEDATKEHESLGWSLPTGGLAAAIRRARQNLRNKMAEKSRDVAIKQAELEQANIQKALDQGIQWEGQLIGYSLDLERIAFESAKVVAENAIAIHNAGVERFKLEMGLVSLRVSVYEAIIKGEQLKIEVLRADIALEQAKADINKALVAQYTAQLEARMAVVRIYEAQLNGARTLMELEKIRVEASAEQIRGYVAGVNGQVAKLEVYKTGAAAEQTRMQAWAEGARAQVAVYAGQADAFRALSGAQGERAKMQIERLRGLSEAKANEFRGYTAQADAEAARMRAQSDVARNLLAGYEATTRALEARAVQSSRIFEARVKQYEAQTSYTLNGQKINSDIIAHNRQMALEAAKAAAQISAQLASSAMSQAHATAGIDGRSSMAVSYQYTNQTATTPESVTSI